jgi:hypothetical protein
MVLWKKCGKPKYYVGFQWVSLTAMKIRCRSIAPKKPPLRICWLISHITSFLVISPYTSLVI